MSVSHGFFSFLIYLRKFFLIALFILIIWFSTVQTRLFLFVLEYYIWTLKRCCFFLFRIWLCWFWVINRWCCKTGRSYVLLAHRCSLVSRQYFCFIIFFIVWFSRSKIVIYWWINIFFPLEAFRSKSRSMNLIRWSFHVDTE